MLATLPRFPCGLDKRPLTARGFYAAKADGDDAAWPLVGVPTGSLSGLDVLDIDPDGVDWYKLEFDALPMTRAHETRRGGLHLWFKHADGLRCSTGRIAPGVDVRGDGGYVIDWSREGLSFEDWPICEWPSWLLALAIGVRSNRDLRRKSAPRVGTTSGVLGTLDVMQYRNRGDWLRVMMAAHAAGIDREEFIQWSTSDPLYAGDAEEIERQWNALRADGGITPWALRVEVRLAQLNRGICPKHPYPIGGCTSQVPSKANGDPRRRIGTETRDLPRRWSSLERIAQRDEPGAFFAACVMREIVAEGRVRPEVAVGLLQGAGVERRVIAAGFLTVEDKL